MQQGRALVLSATATPQQQQLVPRNRGALTGQSRGGPPTLDSHVAGLERGLAAEGASSHRRYMCVPLPVTHIARLSPKETAVSKLKDAVVNARKQVFALHDELALSRNALAKHEQLCSEQQSMVAIKVQLLAERMKLVAGVSDEYRNLLRTEQELEMDEREHTSSFLAALTENEARIRALHRLATEDPENVAAALQAHMQAVSAELELAKRKVACQTIASMPRGTG